MADIKNVNIKVNGKNCWGVLSSGEVLTLPEKESPTSILISTATTDYRPSGGGSGSQTGSKFTATLWQGEFYLPSATQCEYGTPILTIYSSDQTKTLFKLYMYSGDFLNDTYYNALLSNGTYGTAKKYGMRLYAYRYDASGYSVETNTYSTWYPSSSNPIHFWSNATRIHIKITLDEQKKQLLMSIVTRVATKTSNSQNALIGRWTQQKFGTGSNTGQYDALPIVIFNDEKASNTGTKLGELFPIKVRTFRPLIAWNSDKYATSSTLPLVNTYNFPQLKK